MMKNLHQHLILLEDDLKNKILKINNMKIKTSNDFLDTKILNIT